MNRTARDFRGALLVAVTALSSCTGNDHGLDPNSDRNDPASGAASGRSASGGGGSNSSGSHTWGDQAEPANPGGTANVVGGGGAAGLGTGGKPGADLPPRDPSCDLPNAAFCDAFTKASPRGRAGAPDDGHWGPARPRL